MLNWLCARDPPRECGLTSTHSENNLQATELQDRQCSRTLALDAACPDLLDLKELPESLDALESLEQLVCLETPDVPLRLLACL